MKLCEDREATIAAFREMWRWIAEETLKQKRIVWKHEYFEANPSKEMPENAMCYLCDYASHMELEHGFKASTCDYCPIDWGQSNCMGGIVGFTAYINWAQCTINNWEDAARYAKQISELPEKEGE